MMTILMWKSYGEKKIGYGHSNLMSKMAQVIKMIYQCSKSSNAALSFKCSFIISDIDAIKHFLQTIHSLHHKIDVERLSNFS